MHDLLIALVFVTLVATPAVVAAMPSKDEDETPERHAESVDLVAPSPSNGR
jgi:hypothetical protein